MDITGKQILYIGYRGKESHIDSVKEAGAVCNLLIDKSEMKEEYETQFETVHVADDLFDWNQIKEFIHSKTFDAVLTRYEDFTVIVSAVAKELELPSVAFEDAPKFRNKYLMRKAFADAGAPSADFVLVSEAKDADAFLETHEFPLILKQIAGIHSKYVAKVRSREDFEKRLAFFKEAIRTNAGSLQKQLRNYPHVVEEPDPLTYFLLEECLQGIEITIDSFIAGDSIAHTPAVKYILSEEVGFNDHHIPTRIMPYDLPEEDLHIVLQTVEQGYKALGANYCLAHAEVFYEPVTKDCRIIEIASRGGGFRGEMVRRSCSQDLDMGVVLAALGMDPKIEYEAHSYAAVTEVFAPQNGILESIDTSPLNDRDDIFAVTHNKDVGDRVGLASEGESFILKFLLQSDNYDQVVQDSMDLLHRIRDSITIEE